MAFTVQFNSNTISSFLLLSLPVSLLVLSLHLCELCVLLACGWGSKVVRLVAVGSAAAVGECFYVILV